MTKCDFCTYYDPKRGCWWTTLLRQSSCEEAIQKMTKALQGTLKNDNQGKNMFDYRDDLYTFKEDLMDKFIELCRGNDYNKLSLLKIGDVVEETFDKHIEIATDKIENPKTFNLDEYEF